MEALVICAVCLFFAGVFAFMWFVEFAVGRLQQRRTKEAPPSTARRCRDLEKSRAG